MRDRGTSPNFRGFTRRCSGRSARSTGPEGTRGAGLAAHRPALGVAAGPQAHPSRPDVRPHQPAPRPRPSGLVGILGQDKGAPGQGSRNRPATARPRRGAWGTRRRCPSRAYEHTLITHTGEPAPQAGSRAARRVGCHRPSLVPRRAVAGAGAAGRTLILVGEQPGGDGDDKETAEDVRVPRLTNPWIWIGRWGRGGAWAAEHELVTPRGRPPSTISSSQGGAFAVSVASPGHAEDVAFESRVTAMPRQIARRRDRRTRQASETTRATTNAASGARVPPSTSYRLATASTTRPSRPGADTISPER